MGTVRGTPCYQPFPPKRSLSNQVVEEPAGNGPRLHPPVLRRQRVQGRDMLAEPRFGIRGGLKVAFLDRLPHAPEIDLGPPEKPILLRLDVHRHGEGPVERIGRVTSLGRQPPGLLRWCHRGR